MITIMKILILNFVKEVKQEGQKLFGLQEKRHLITTAMVLLMV